MGLRITSRIIVTIMELVFTNRLSPLFNMDKALYKWWPLYYTHSFSMWGSFPSSKSLNSLVYHFVLQMASIWPTQLMPLNSFFTSPTFMIGSSPQLKVKGLFCCNMWQLNWAPGLQLAVPIVLWVTKPYWNALVTGCKWLVVLHFRPIINCHRKYVSVSVCVCIFNETAIGQVNEGSKHLNRSSIANLFIIDTLLQMWIRKHFVLYFLSYNSVICLD